MAFRHIFGFIFIWLLTYPCQSANSKGICITEIPIEISIFDQHGFLGQMQQFFIFPTMALELQEEFSNSVHHGTKQFNGSYFSGQENYHLSWNESFYLDILWQTNRILLMASSWNNVASKNVITTLAMTHLADGCPPPGTVVANTRQSQQIRQLAPGTTDVGCKHHHLPAAKVFCA